MDKLQAIFKTEAEELLSDLERAVLTFENDLSSMESVREIFRVMHTLKGSASMFGFESLSAFTHDLETVFDDIRNGKAKATDYILEITLESVDHIKNLINDPGLTNSKNAELHKLLLSRIASAFQENDSTTPITESRNCELITYYIYFRPSREIFDNGSNPLFLVDDLARLGESHVIPTFIDVPELDNIKQPNCHVAFEILLATSETEDTLREVFLFVEDKAEITIKKLSADNIILNKEFISAIETISFDKGARPIYGYDGISDLLQKVQMQPEKTTSKNIQREKKEGSTIRVSSEKLDELMNLVSELVTSQARLSLLSQHHQLTDLMGVSETMEKLTRRLRDSAFTICLVPIESLVIRFQRLVRDLAKELDKEIEFVAEGTDTELDRSIIERITDPILHILRNCIDHGMESPDERQRAGKNPRGKILLKAYHAGTNVIIEISDDGRGINPRTIRQKAIERGIIPQDDHRTDSELVNLIFTAGFSTAAEVTDVSGRGVGMDIVKRNIESIHGEVHVRSVVGQGTTINIRLPLTLSILDGMLVQIGDSQYLLPLSAIQSCHEIESHKLAPEIAQKHVLNSELLPVFNLYSAFDCTTKRESVSYVIKLHYPDFPAGIAVDRIIGEYQAVMKPLGDMYKGHDEFSGATILGDGSVALVLDTTTLLRTLIKNEMQTVKN